MRLFGSIVVAVSLLAMPSAFAQMHNHGMQPTAQGAASSASMMSEGEVRKVDKENGKITLRHGELKNLQMPPMTMVFQVKDKAMLDKVKTGDKVRFAADNVDGQLTVTAIEPSR